MAFFHVLFPIALVLWTVGVIENSKAFSDSIFPVSFITVSQILALSFWLKPDVNPPALLLIILPVANVLLSNICPVHGPHPAFYIFFPLAFKVIAWRVIIHFSIAFLHVILEVALKDTSTFEDYLSFSLFFALNPLTFVNSIIYGVFPVAVTEAVLYLSLVSASVGPFIYAFPCDSVIRKLSVVYNAIRPYKFTFAV